MTEFDAIVIGGGPVGAMLGLMLAPAGRSVAVIEARSSQSNDSRILALSWGTRLIFESLNLWSGLPVTPIKRICVSQQNGFGRVHFTSDEMGLPELGYVVRYVDIERMVSTELRKSGVEFIEGTRIDRLDPGYSRTRLYSGQKRFDTHLAVFADGGKLAEEQRLVTMNEKRYAELALVARITLEVPAAGEAYERFTSNGPLALLPSGSEYSLVWVLKPDEAEAYRTMHLNEFLIRLNRTLDQALPVAINAHERAVFPLLLREAVVPVAHRVALIGNAAQTLHPVAGQGFNLGIRDARDLAGVLVQSHGDWGDETLLQAYVARRRADSGAGLWWTDHLVEWFSSHNFMISVGRGMGLSAIEILPGLRKWISRKMIFGWQG